jgi:hypothetical protein
MFSGQPCYYKGDGCCSIYEDRPEQPCKAFKCEWLTNEEYPAWMKPSLSHSLHTKRIYTDENGNQYEYLEAVEAGKPISTEVLFFCMLQYFKTNMPFRIQINGNHHSFGPPGFDPQ